MSRTFVDGPFASASRVRKVDVVVCTHNDADHSAGLLGFFSSSLICDEVWLPGVWADRLCSLLEDPSEFYYELAHDINRMEWNGEEEATLGALGDRLESDHMQRPADGEGTNGRAATDGTDHILEVLDNASVSLGYDTEPQLGMGSQRWLLGGPYPMRYFWDGNPATATAKTSLFLEGIAAGNVIAKLALEAYRSNAIIRWFEHQPNSTGQFGREGRLLALNSAPVAAVCRKRFTALEYLSLSASNKKCLVFYAPAASGPAVLFTADSDLASAMPVSVEPNTLVTAMHHGAAANERAYKRLAELAGDAPVAWVRSDCRSRKRPASWYVNAPPPRYCTLCNRADSRRQHVRLIGDAAGWRADRCRECVCE